jgi:hypothetical protein
MRRGLAEGTVRGAWGHTGRCSVYCGADRIAPRQLLPSHREWRCWRGGCWTFLLRCSGLQTCVEGVGKGEGVGKVWEWARAREWVRWTG